MEQFAVGEQMENEVDLGLKYELTTTANDDKDDMEPVLSRRKEKDMESIQMKRKWISENLMMEPKEDEDNVIIICILLPSGKRIKRRFLKTDSLTTLKNFLWSIPEVPDEFHVGTQFPRRKLVVGPTNKNPIVSTFAEADISSRDMLYVTKAYPVTLKMFHFESDSIWPSLRSESILSGINMDEFDDGMIKVILNHIITSSSDNDSSSSSPPQIGTKRKVCCHHLEPPRPAVTAYNYFVRQFCTDNNLSTDVQDLEFDDVSSESDCGQRWKSMTDEERDPFQTMENADKMRYSDEMKYFKVKRARFGLLTVADMNRKPEKLSAFEWFCKDLTPVLESLFPDITKVGIAMRWDEAEPIVKLTYEAIQQLSEQRYEQELSVYTQQVSGNVLGSS